MQELKTWRHFLVGKVRVQRERMRGIGEIVRIGLRLDPERLAEIRAAQERDLLPEFDAGFFVVRKAGHDREAVALERDQPVAHRGGIGERRRFAPRQAIEKLRAPALGRDVGGVWRSHARPMSGEPGCMEHGPVRGLDAPIEDHGFAIGGDRARRQILRDAEQVETPLLRLRIESGGAIVAQEQVREVGNGPIRPMHGERAFARGHSVDFHEFSSRRMMSRQSARAHRRRPPAALLGITVEEENHGGSLHPGKERRKLSEIGAPKGNRTPVFAVRGRRPGPLDDGSGMRPKARSISAASCERKRRERAHSARASGLGRGP